MKKRDLKALAMMGLTLGVMMSAQQVQAQEGTSSGEQAGTFLAAKCGGNGKCGHLNLVNYTSGGSCGAQPAPNYQQPSHSCGAQPAQGYSQQPSHSCGAQPAQGYNQSKQPQVIYGGVVSQGCSPRTQNPNGAGAQNSQSGWYTADAAKEPSTTYQNPAANDAKGHVTVNKVVITEQDLKANPDYASLSPEGKAAALRLANQLANQSCKGQNECAGLSSCKNGDHSCAGQNSCRGKGTGPFKDKNLAAKIAVQKVKRNQANGTVNGKSSH